MCVTFVFNGLIAEDLSRPAPKVRARDQIKSRVASARSESTRGGLGITNLRNSTGSVGGRVIRHTPYAIAGSPSQLSLQLHSSSAQGEEAGGGGDEQANTSPSPVAINLFPNSESREQSAGEMWQSTERSSISGESDSNNNSVAEVGGEGSGRIVESCGFEVMDVSHGESEPMMGHGGAESSSGSGVPLTHLPSFHSLSAPPNSSHLAAASRPYNSAGAAAAGTSLQDCSPRFGVYNIVHGPQSAAWSENPTSYHSHYRSNVPEPLASAMQVIESTMYSLRILPLSIYYHLFLLYDIFVYMSPVFYIISLRS